MPVKMKPLELSASDVILVGDPRRAFALAQEVTVQPRMSHQARGLWGYTGETTSGHRLTVQSTGAGGPSAVPVIGDLVENGAARFVRLGTCLSTGHECGEILLVTGGLALDGASRSLIGQTPAEAGTPPTVSPDQGLTRLLEGLGEPTTVASYDLVARHESRLARTRREPRDLQTAATLALTRRLGVPAAALLVVVDGRGGRLEESDLKETFRPLARSVATRLERGTPT